MLSKLARSIVLVAAVSGLGTLKAGAADSFTPGFSLPSYVTLSLGGDSEQSFNSSLDLGLTLKNDWQLKVGLEHSLVPDPNQRDDMTVDGARLGILTDPLELLSGGVAIEAWKMNDDVEGQSAKGQLTVAPANWLISIEVGAGTLKFLHLPRLIWSSRESTVVDRFGSIDVEYFINRNWSVRAFASKHSYDKELSDYADGLRVLFIPSSVLTTVTGFPQQEATAGLGYTRSKISVGLDIGTQTSALDHVRSKKAALSLGYRMNASWALHLYAGAVKPENSEASAGADNHFATVSVTHSWK